MAKIVYENHQSRFFDLLGSTKKSAVLVSPFLKKDMAEEISRYLNENIKLKVLTRLDNESMRQNAQDPEALIVFNENFSNLEIKILDDLHAKIYLFDNKKALVTSANLTTRAFKSNIEYGILLDEPEEIESVIEDVKKLYSKATRFEDYESSIISLVEQSKRKRSRSKDSLIDAIKLIRKTSRYPVKRPRASKPKPGTFSLNEIEPIHFNGPRITKIRRLKLGDVIELDSKNHYDSKNYVEFNLSGAHKIISSKAYKLVKSGFLIIEERINNSETKFTRKSNPLMVGNRIDDPWSEYKDGIRYWITSDPVFLGYFRPTKEKPDALATFEWRGGKIFSYIVNENGPQTWVRLRSLETDSEITLSQEHLIMFIS